MVVGRKIVSSDEGLYPKYHVVRLVFLLLSFIYNILILKSEKLNAFNKKQLKKSLNKSKLQTGLYAENARKNVCQYKYM